MLNSIQIENFRCFRSLELSDVGQFNVIVGDSGTGKTAFLEALFMCAGTTPEFFLRTMRWRGSLGGQIRVDPNSYGPLWGELFFGLDQSSTVSIRFTDSVSGARWLRIRSGLPDGESLTLPLLPQGLPVDTAGFVPITFEAESGGGKRYIASLRVDADGSIKIPAFIDTYPMTFLSSATLLNPENNAKHFSDLSKRGEEIPLVEAVTSLYPHVQDLHLEIHGGANVIFASVRGIKGKIPIGSVSSGITKCVAILLAIALCPGGAVAIDEIENSFYYHGLPDIWSTIVRFCAANETQLFVTTHSLEFVRAMRSAVEGREDRFRLLRTEMRNGECTIRSFSGRDLYSSIKQEVEIR